jgi:hypothetical protein
LAAHVAIISYTVIGYNPVFPILLEYFWKNNALTMGKIIQPGEKKIDGPFLLSRKDLEELVPVINEIDEILKQSLASEIEEAIEDLKDKNNAIPEERLNKRIELLKDRYIFSSEKSSFQFSLRTGNTHEENSLSELIKQTEKNKDGPLALKVILRHGSNNTFQFWISKGDKEDGVEYKIKCNDESLKDTAIEKLSVWIDRNAPRKPTVLWNGLGVVIAVFSVISLLIASFSSSDDRYENYESLLKKEAHQILDSGVNSRNMNKTLDVLLKLESNYRPQNYIPKLVEVGTPQTLWIIYSIAFFFIGVLRPQTTLGIGSRRLIFDFYVWWVRVIMVAVPVSFIYPSFQDYIMRWLHLK